MTAPFAQLDGSAGTALCGLSGGAMTAEESALFAAQVAELAQSGLPLSGGLRALADELPGAILRGPRLAGMLREMAGELERGTPPDRLMESWGGRLPPSLRGVLVAGVRVGRLGELLEAYVGVQRREAALRRRVRNILAYPAFLVGVLTLLLVFLSAAVVPMMAQIVTEFNSPLPVLTRVVLTIGSHWREQLAMVVVVMGSLGWLALGRHGVWGERIAQALPLIGLLRRYSATASFARLASLFLRQGMPLSAAIRLAADGADSAVLRQACAALAQDVDNGRSPAEALGQCRSLPPTLLPLVAWGQRASALPEAFDTAAEMYEARTLVQTHLLDALLPVVTFIAIGAMAALFAIAMLMPFIRFIQGPYW
jgi:type II secretory pathway component PulF